METSLINRVQATLLALATAALFVLAVFNLLQERQFQQPDDGVWWREATGGLQAERVLPDMAGQRAGIQMGDLLTGVSDSPNARVTAVSRIADLERALYRTGPYGQVYYVITRDGIPLDTPVKVIPEPLDRSLARACASSASSIWPSASMCSSAAGRLRAPPTSISSAWSPSRSTRSSTPAQLDPLDWTVFWTNVLAESLQPALFLHFALSFPEERLKNIRRRWLLPLVYAPGAGLLGLWLWPSTAGRPPGCSSTAWTRPAPPTTPSSTFSPRCSSCAVTAAPTRPCCASN